MMSGQTRSTILVCLLMASSLLVVGLLFITLPLHSALVATYGVGASQASLVSITFGLPYAVGFLVWGPVSDRWGREQILVPGLVATALISLVVAEAGSFPILIVARAAQGFAASTVPPTVLAIVTERLSPRRRPLGVSAISLCFLAAAPLAQLVGSAFARDGLRPLMLVAAILFFGCACGVWSLTRWDVFRSKLSDQTTDRSISIHREKIVLAAWASAATVLFAYVVFNAGLQHLRGILPFDVDTIRVLSLPTLSFTLVSSVLIQRYGPLRMSQIGSAIIVAGLVIACIGGKIALLAGSTIMTIGVALACPSLIATVATQARPSERGLAVAVYAFALYAGASLAPLIADAVADGGLLLVCLTPAAVSTLGLISLIAVSDRKSVSSGKAAAA